MRIGFFDSGIGGLTLLKCAISKIDGVEFVYYADIDNVPYGNKDKSVVKKIVFDIVDFLVNKKKCDIIVLACNTATSVAAKELRAFYKNIPIIGMEPAVKPAVSIATNNKRVLVLATELTLKEEKFNNLVSAVDKMHIVDSVAASKLVTFAENFNFYSDEVINYLTELLSNYDLSKYCSIVLGCTHFIYFKDAIKKIIPKDVSLVDGNLGTVKNLENILKKLNYQKVENKISIYQSSREIDVSLYKELL